MRLVHPRVIALVVSALAILCGVLAVSLVLFLGAPDAGEHGQTAEENAGTPLIEKMFSRFPLMPNLLHRPRIVAVVIENHESARPHQEGLDDALMVEEWLVEGFISRFVAIFDRGNMPALMGPVRSLRPYMFEGLLPWSAVLLHAGGSPEALELAAGSKRIVDINGLYGAYYGKFERIEGIPAPHDLFIRRAGAESLAAEEDLPGITWPPYHVGMAPAAPAATEIAVNFFSPVHDVQYAYDERTQRYDRTNGDVENQAHPSNVLFLEIPITEVGEYGRLHIQVQGKGKALLFRSGKVYEGRWEKKNDTTAFSFTNGEGDPLSFAHGQTWMTVLPSLERVTWETENE